MLHNMQKNEQLKILQDSTERLLIATQTGDSVQALQSLFSHVDTVLAVAVLAQHNKPRVK